MTMKPVVTHYVLKEDNLVFLERNKKTLYGKVDFVYLDPPVVEEVKGNMKRQLERWMNALKARLVAVVPVLKPTGVVVASVKDSELPRFRLMCDEVFGWDNFIGMITVDTGNVINNARFLSSAHEYILVYAADKTQLLKSGTKWRLPREGLDALRRQEKQLRAAYGEDYESVSSGLKSWLAGQNLPKRLKQFYNADSKGLYTFADLSAPKNGLFYEVVNPNTGNPVAIPTRGWGVKPETFQTLIANDQIIWGATDDNQPLKKYYLKDEPDQVPRSVMRLPSRSPERLLDKILGTTHPVVKEPKDLDFMVQLLELMTPQDAVILDLYAGSGTTGHAVLDLNYRTGSSRQVFLVNTNEGGLYNNVLLPRMNAVVTGKWADRQHRPRKSIIQTSYPLNTGKT